MSLDSKDDHDILIELRTRFNNLENTFVRTWDTINQKFVTLHTELEKRDVQHEKLAAMLERKADKADVDKLKLDVSELKRWRYYLTGVFALAGIIAGMFSDRLIDLITG